LPDVQDATLLSAADDPTLADNLEGESGFELVGDVLTRTKITIFGDHTGLGFFLLLLLRLPATTAAPDHRECKKKREQDDTNGHGQPSPEGLPHHSFLGVHLVIFPLPSARLL
jgi:hypothetical protein